MLSARCDVPGTLFVGLLLVEKMLMEGLEENNILQDNVFLVFKETRNRSIMAVVLLKGESRF